MKIYLDTGNLDEIREIAELGLIDGVTTNPSLIAKEGKDFKYEIKEIIKILKKQKNDFTVSAEVINTQFSNEMIIEGRNFAKMDKHILVKIPLTKEGLKAVKVLSKEGIKCNVTLCFSSNQALLAAKAGAFCVSPFVGRVEDEGYDGIELLKEIKVLFTNYNFQTKILGASIRSCEHVHKAAQLGVDIVTIPTSIYKKLYYNPLTEIGIKKFEFDWKNYKNHSKK